MFKKFTLIIILSIALIAFLIVRPFLFDKVEEPRIEDRLPEADFIGRAYLLDLARETSSMLQFNDVNYRDLLTYEFMLSQSKLYGLDLQNPVYFFAHENGNIGCLIPVADSTKILDGISRIHKLAPIKDSVGSFGSIYQYEKGRIYLAYSKDFVLLYKGSNFSSIYQRVMGAKRDDISPCWRAFLNEKLFKDEKLVVYSNWNTLKESGIETAIFAHDSDSIRFKVKTYIRNSKPINIALKKGGYDFKYDSKSKKIANLHLDISQFIKDKTSSLYKYILTLGKRISFPTEAFLNAWDGDLSFKEGGLFTQKETYIESVMDENFNVTDVEKVKETKVTGYSVMITMNSKGPSFMNLLMKKGILNKDGDYYRFLFSPQLTMQKKKNSYLFYSGSTSPKMVKNDLNYGEWYDTGLHYSVSLDSLNMYEAFGSFNVPAKLVLKKNKFF
jgi:hypothetical protein